MLDFAIKDLLETCVTEIMLRQTFPTKLKLEVKQAQISLKWLNTVFLRLNSVCYHCLPDISITLCVITRAKMAQVAPRRNENHFST